MSDRYPPRGRGDGRGRGEGRGRGDGRGRGGSQQRPPKIQGPAPGSPAKECQLITNFFPCSFPSKVYHVYRVDYENPSIPEERLTKGKTHAIFSACLDLKKIPMGTLFDGKHTIYCPEDLGDEIKATVTMKGTKKESSQGIALKMTGKVDISKNKLDSETVQILELFIRSILGSKEDSIVKGNRIYDGSQKIPLRESDLVIVPGFAHAFRFCEAGLLLNTDIVHAIVIDALPIDVYIMTRVKALLGSRARCTIEEVFSTKELTFVKRTINKELSGKIFKLEHLKNSSKKKISKIVPETARKKTFDLIDKSTNKTTKTSVEAYYKKMYNITLKEADKRPLIMVIRQNREEFYPLELCYLTPNQTRTNISSAERTDIISTTRKDIQDRFEIIVDYAQYQLQGLESKTMKIQVQPNAVVVGGKILAPPQIEYGSNMKVSPSNGAWNIKDIPLKQPQKGLSLALVYPTRTYPKDRDQFEDELARIAKASGVFFKEMKRILYEEDQPGSSSELKSISSSLIKERASNPNLMAVIVLPNKDTKRYNSLKTAMDLNVQISSQFITVPNFQKCDASTLANVVAAINVKYSNSVGKNASVKLDALNVPGTIIGIDVHHPPVGSFRPSEAAISASLDSAATSYYSTFRTQESRQESIKEIGDMFEEVLHQAEARKIPPFQIIIILRDGVADTQFDTICVKELEMLRKVIAVNPYYAKTRPKILYIVAQKRNLCRLGAKLGEDIVTPAAGTIVDRKITSSSKEFYLVGHKAIQGSAKPVRYTIFEDEIKVTVAAVQELLFRLCHLHPGCTRSVSLPAPLYNAHKLAYRIGQVYRAAYEAEDDMADSSSASGSEIAEPVKITLPEFIKFTPFFL